MTDITAQPMFDHKYNATVIALFVLVGPFVGLLIALPAVIGADIAMLVAKPDLLVFAAVLVYIFGGIPALVAGACAARAARLSLAPRIGVAVAAGLAANAAICVVERALFRTSLLSGSSLTHVLLTSLCAVAAAVVCTVLAHVFVRTR